MFTNPFSPGYKPLVDHEEEQEVFDPQTKIFSEDDSSSDEETISKYKEISTWRVVLNTINNMEGVGFLALPYAIHEGGIAVLIGVVVLAVIMGYSTYLLADCLDDEDKFGERKRVRWTYQDIGMACWPPFRHVIWVLVSINIYIFSCSFIVLCGSMMSQQFPNVPISESQWACLGTALVLPTTFLEKLSDIAWISVISTIVLIASACIVFGYEFPEVPHWDLHSLLFWDTRGVFIGLSIIAMSYGIHTTSVPMAAEVSKLSRYKKALIWTFTFGAIFKVIFAVSGFLTYTSATNQVIINNLPTSIPVQIIGSLFVLNVLLTYPILILVLVNNIEELTIYQKLTNKVPLRISFFLIRIFVALAILAFAVGIPEFALVSALSGCVCFCNGLVFPGLFHLRLKYKQLSKFQVLADITLVILGIISTIFGLTTTILSLVAAM